MPKFVIERNVPGAGQMTQEELQAISAQSMSVLNALGPDVQWVHSYVVDEKIYCIYNARNAAVIEEHARRGNFPCDRIAAVSTMIDPTTAEGA